MSLGRAMIFPGAASGCFCAVLAWVVVWGPCSAATGASGLGTSCRLHLNRSAAQDGSPRAAQLNAKSFAVPRNDSGYGAEAVGRKVHSLRSCSARRWAQVVIARLRNCTIAKFIQYPGETDASDPPEPPEAPLPLRDETPLMVPLAGFVCAPP